MQEQLPLAGFDLQVTESQARVLSRRRSDHINRLPAYNPGLSATLSVVNETAPAYPLRIYTLGRFSLLYKGMAINYGRKAPRRALDLLKVLVALGGRGVSSSSIMAELWPDADGDTAKQSFDTTLHRLRKLIGDERVLVLSDGKLSLDARHCWIDIWTFERLLGQAQRIRTAAAGGEVADMLERLSTHLLSLYQGHFLVSEDVSPGSVSIRERLRSKYIHSLVELGYYWELHGFHDKAMLCYRKGLEVDDLVEVFYQRLMYCCLQTKRLSEGMSVYRHCRQVLSVVLGLQPEPETESLYGALKRARLQHYSAESR